MCKPLVTVRATLLCVAASLGCDRSAAPESTPGEAKPPMAQSSQALSAAGAACKPPEGLVTEASRWQVDLKPESAWTNLSPWAFWAIEAVKPRIFVELGTHWGYSYFAFCQAITKLKLPTRAFAVDTWQGDDHAGRYGENVFQSVKQCQDKRFASFSNLLRTTFDEAAKQFEDGSIDLLHIDGQHYYEDVKHDFETWKPKLSTRAVVLFHDVGVRQGSFGVYRFWEEVAAQYPHHAFYQGPGLGILGVGKELPPAMARLFALNEADSRCVDAAYSALGDAAQAHHAPVDCRD